VLGNPESPHFQLLGELAQPPDLHIGADADFVDREAPLADVLLHTGVDGSVFRRAWPLAKRVRWVHSLWAGVDRQLSPELLANPAPFTNGRGVFAIALAEWAIGAMLFFGHDLRRLVRQQEAGIWEQFESALLRGHMLGIVGYGEIGRAVAELARPFGMKISAIRRRPELSGSDPLIDAAYPPEKLHELMAASDYVVMATPLTTQTRGMIGEAEIAAMKPSAVVINVGRGQAVQEAALIAALEAGKIRGAALDVFETEPLPAGHPFYSLKNVLISPHAADQTPGWNLRATECFLDNFRRFRAGESLKNVVDKHAGY